MTLRPSPLIAPQPTLATAATLLDMEAAHDHGHAHTVYITQTQHPFLDTDFGTEKKSSVFISMLYFNVIKLCCVPSSYCGTGSMLYYLLLSLR